MIRIISALRMCACVTIAMITVHTRVEAAAPSGETITLSVTNPRPVRMALRQLSQNHGYALTYEDPLYQYMDDLEDVTDKISRQALKPGQPRMLDPKNGTISVGYELASDGKPRDILEVVGKLLEADAKRIGSRFTLFQDGEFIHVVPTRTRDTTGGWVARGSLLDAKISIPAEERSVEQFFEAICQELSKTAGLPVKSGTVPLNAFIKTKTSQGADNQVARDVVVELLSIFKPYKLTWSLNYDPMLRNYIFNVTFIADAAGKIQRSLPVPPPSKSNDLTPMGPRTK